MTSEQRVRTEAGWIGVEISKSRVRTPGRDGYGLYRVRGSMPVVWSIRAGGEIDRSPGQSEPTLWTAYAFTLDEISRRTAEAIGFGTPDGPRDMVLCAVNPRPGQRPAVVVPTRWTSAYGGRRDLGVTGEPAAGPSIDAGLLRPTAGRRRKTANAEFQAVHKPRRDAGLAARHATKLSRREPGGNGAPTGPAQPLPGA